MSGCSAARLQVNIPPMRAGGVTESGRKTPARLAGSAVFACQSDARLVGLVHEGHERAFEAIVHRYRRPLLRYCSQILPDSRTEDAVQQAFINAHAALQSGHAPLQLKAWLYTITRNAALNMLRQNGWNYEQIPLDFDGVRRPDQVFEQRIELQQTVAAVNALPERQRDALVMREFEGRSYDEIALALNANDGAVRQLLNRARVALRNAASLVMPPPLVARAAASIPPSDGRRLGGVFGGLGAAGVAKAGATALVAGSLVVGVVNAPLPLGDSHKTTRQKATLAAREPVARHTHKARDIEVATRTPALRSPLGQRAHGAPAAGHRHSGITHHGEGERHQPAERRERSGGGTDGRSGGSNDRGTRDTSGSSGSPSTSGGGGAGGPPRPSGAPP